MQPSVGLLFALGLSACLTVNAGPHVRRDDVSIQNAEDAIALKYAFHTPLFAMVADNPLRNSAWFETLTPTSPCEADEVACVNDSVASCVDGQFVLTSCNAGLVYVISAYSDGMRVVMLTVAQVSSLPQYRFPRDHHRLYCHERESHAYCCDRGEFHKFHSASRPFTDISLLGSGRDLFWFR